MLDFQSPNFSLSQLELYLEAKKCSELRKSQLCLLLRDLNNNLVRLKRIKSTSTTADEESILVLSLSIKFFVILVENSIEEVLALSDILDKLKSDDWHVQQIILKLQVENTLRKLQEAFSFESNPLNLVCLMWSEFNEAKEMVAVLIYLLERGVLAEEIIDSVFLDAYFFLNIYHIEDINFTYRLLGECSCVNVLEKEKLLSLLASTRVYESASFAFNNYYLNGQQISKDVVSFPRKSVVEKSILNIQDLSNILSSRYSWDMLSFDSLRNLCVLFGNYFLTRALLFASANILKRYIITLDKAAIIDIFNYINTRVSFEDNERRLILEQFLTYIEDELILELVMTKKIPIWKLLVIKPSLLNQLNIKFILSLQEKVEVQLQDVQEAFRLTKYKNFLSLKDIIYIKIFNLCLDNHTFCVGEEVIDAFKSSDCIQDKVKLRIVEMQTQFDNIMSASFADGVNDISVLSVVDYGKSQMPMWRCLKRLSVVSIGLPLDAHQINAAVIKWLYCRYLEAFSDIFLIHTLNLLYPCEIYSRISCDEKELRFMQNGAKFRGILEALKISQYINLNRLILDSIESEYLEFIADENVAILLYKLDEVDSSNLLSSMRIFLRKRFLTSVSCMSSVNKVFINLNLDMMSWFFTTITRELTQELFEEVICFLITKDVRVLKFISIDLRSNYDFMFKVFTIDDRALSYANKAVSMQIVKDDGYSLKYVSRKFRDDEELVLVAVRNNGYALQYAEVNLRCNRKLVLEAVQVCGDSLKYAHNTLREDIDIVLVAVHSYGYALQHVGEKLKNHKLVVSEAIKKDANALRYASNDLRNDLDIVQQAYSEDKNSLQYALKAVVLIILARDGSALQYVSSAFKCDKEVVSVAIKQNYTALEYAEFDFQDDKAFMLLAVMQNGCALKYASDDLRDDSELVLAAVRQNHAALRYASKDLRNDLSFLFKIYQQSNYSLNTAGAFYRKLLSPALHFMLRYPVISLAVSGIMLNSSFLAIQLAIRSRPFSLPQATSSSTLFNKHLVGDSIKGTTNMRLIKS